ncbi:MAG: hypothetical protein A3D53_03750 [Candidatus Magasanikbacteria bacterium RIFCSPHIGHO2_02_FULL_45_10]|uniref:Polysaccharide chain length determinant N-terminal domain-containing protein n=1 Tax=Candidatus Magasanikbacteria bacterium RIFCSPHIGHO2_02_FULL_45_10 TaxID=1798679 RepID=A0A1F6MB18_9BACT|nr:MAG: hypothetical protein A3D53_03750 [Candidatus Magasanikbacteria bacterium RIFCSPHIGHO2_02_FULL_45_10]
MFELWQFIRESFRYILGGAIGGVIFLNGLSLLNPIQYKAESQVLLITRDRTGVDPYTQAKSAERFGDNLARVMQTSDFFNKVISSTVFSFNKEYWTALDAHEQRERWGKNVQSEIIYNSSLLRITAYADSKDEAVRLLNAITHTATSRGWEYIGGDVTLKQVDDPIVSRFPARPRFVVNTLAGLLGGAGAVFFWLWYRREKTPV